MDDEEFVVFDSDLGLDWEVGPDMEIIFTPDQSERLGEAA